MPECVQLGLFDPRPAPPQRAEADAVALARFLQGRGWLTAADLKAGLGWNERRVRAAAAASTGDILSGPGMPGYRITREASADERDSAIAALRAQARRMIARSIRISKCHHTFA